jgi:hypothetical protein
MTTDITILMLIAIAEAVAIGWLLADKLGLIKKTKIDDNPKNNKWDTDSTEYPSRQVKQGKCDNGGYDQNDHNATSDKSNASKSLIFIRHCKRIIRGGRC